MPAPNFAPSLSMDQPQLRGPSASDQGSELVSEDEPESFGRSFDDSSALTISKNNQGDAVTKRGYRSKAHPLSRSAVLLSSASGPGGVIRRTPSFSYRQATQPGLCSAASLGPVESFSAGVDQYLIHRGGVSITSPPASVALSGENEQEMQASASSGMSVG